MNAMTWNDALQVWARCALCGSEPWPSFGPRCFSCVMEKGREPASEAECATYYEAEAVLADWAQRAEEQR